MRRPALGPARSLVAGLALTAFAPALHSCRARSEPAAPAIAAHTRRVRARDVTLHVVELGPDRGPVRIVIHGGPGLDHTYMRPWFDSLGARTRLIYVDLRGHGRSTAPAEADGYTIRAAAADLADVIASLGFGGPADILAHDFGTAVAMELAAQHPERVRRLILIDPMRDPGQLAAIPQRSRETLGEAGWQRVRDLTTPQGTLRDAHGSVELFRRLGRMWWHRQPSDAVLARMGRDMLYRADADAHFLVDGATWDGRARAPEIRAPALVISGADDHTFPAVESRALSELLPHGRYAEIADAGHLPFVEQPERFMAIVDRFLRNSADPE